MIALTHDMFDHRWPRASHALTTAIVAGAPSLFEKYGIATASEAADFLAQCSVECAAGASLEENLNYSAERAHEVWPAYFPTAAAAAPYAHNPRALADRVYGGRMGNRMGTDDGFNFRGRGLIDISGRSWYEKISEGELDLVNDPDLAASPALAFEIACAFWKIDGVNVFAASGDFRRETIRVNGGLTDYATRLTWRAIWRRELGVA